LPRSDGAGDGPFETQSFGDFGNERRYAAWLHELDAWTEYWDIYHPETEGHFYFGNGANEQGLLTKILPRERRPPVFVAWTQMALSDGGTEDFKRELGAPEVSAAVMEVDALVADIFRKYFGDAADSNVPADYLEAVFRCATDSLPPATERDARIAAADWRKPTAGRHMIDNDLMWFAWAFHLEAAHEIAGRDEGHARRALQLAGVATGASANFAWRGHRRTRPEYHRDDRTIALLRERGLRWALDFDGVAAEVHALFRIREWGHE
jgi:hypothetical protein